MIDLNTPHDNNEHRQNSSVPNSSAPTTPSEPTGAGSPELQDLASASGPDTSASNDRDNLFGAENPGPDSFGPDDSTASPLYPCEARDSMASEDSPLHPHEARDSKQTNAQGTPNQGTDQNGFCQQSASQNAGPQYTYQGPLPEPIFIHGELNRPALKSDAHDAMEANYWPSVGASALPNALSGLISAIPGVGSVLAGLFAPIFRVGGIRVNQKIVAKQPRVSLDRRSGLFSGFEQFGDLFVAFFTTNLFIFLWSLLFLVPGIIKSYEWALVPYLLAENPRIKGSEARDLSAQMMDGHKMELFVLQLSFLGWWILSALTFGLLAVFYVSPYYAITVCDYYENLKALEGVDVKARADGQA